MTTDEAAAAVGCWPTTFSHTYYYYTSRETYDDDGGGDGSAGSPGRSFRMIIIKLFIPTDRNYLVIIDSNVKIILYYNNVYDSGKREKTTTIRWRRNRRRRRHRSTHTVQWPKRTRTHDKEYSDRPSSEKTGPPSAAAAGRCASHYKKRRRRRRARGGFLYRGQCNENE